MFIFFYFISSGLLLLSTLQNGRSGFLPWIFLSTIGMIFHIESIISGFLKMLAYCDSSYGSRIFIQLIMIYGFEIYAIIIVYHYYKQLGKEIVNQTNGRVFSCEDNAQNYVNNIPDVVTCPMPNDLPPSYDQVVGNTPQRYPVY
ncbi:uncharacterized protein LOC122850066 [Aphidius gifuensis]|nr:uncharacterized protein LOC122850066 [Aphidius gifuensis]